MAKEEVLPVWVTSVDTLKLGLRSNIWLQARGRPIRGWLLQQLVKLAVARSLNVDIVVHADSDVVLLRPFSTDTGRRAGRPGAACSSAQAMSTRLCPTTSAGIDRPRGCSKSGQPNPMADYISTLVPWKRKTRSALLDHVEKTTGRHWIRAVAAAWDVSEYVLYGRFVRDVLGASGGQFVSLRHPSAWIITNACRSRCPN